MRVNGSCSNISTTCNINKDDDDYFGLEFWLILIIGAAAGALIIIIKVFVFCIVRRFW